MSQPATKFQQDAARAAADSDQRLFIQHELSGYATVRAATQNSFSDYEQARTAAAEIKWAAIEHLDQLLEQFADNLESNGSTVHWCENSDQACQAILEILRKHDVHCVVKSKCMTTEEIHLNELLESEGFEVVESDLG